MLKQQMNCGDEERHNITVKAQSNCHWLVYDDGRYVGHASRGGDVVTLYGPYGNTWQITVADVGWDPAPWIQGILA